MGQMRFQWWRDAIKAAYDDRPPNHPVALALAHVLHSPGLASVAAAAQTAAATSGGGGCPDNSSNLDSGSASGCGGGSQCGVSAPDASSRAATGPARFSRYCFKRIIDSREADFLDPQPPLDLTALEKYAEGTASQLVYLQVGAGLGALSG